MRTDFKNVICGKKQQVVLCHVQDRECIILKPLDLQLAAFLVRGEKGYRDSCVFIW